MNLDLILASTSPYRRAQIERLGVPFRAVAPTVDEEALKHQWRDRSPRDLAERLAEAKARSIAEIEPEATVIGGDQLVELDGQILGKPGTTERAEAQLARMAGRTHHLITALAVIHAGRVHAHTEVAALAVRPLSAEAIRRYVAADHSAIIGVPLIALATILQGIGYAIP